MKISSAFAALVFSLAWSAPSHAAGDGIVKIERAGKAPVLYLATIPDAPTKVGAILFAGSNGVVGLAEKGIPHPGGNFLVRSRQLFSGHGIATTVFDPSADSAPLTDAIRMSATHAEEVKLVLDDFKKKYGLDEIYLVGTSRGTVSAAYLALQFKDNISGVVLTSTVFSRTRSNYGLDGFDFGNIKVPLLFVHHRQDGCKSTRPAGAENMSKRYKVIFIEGGEDGADACGPFSHHGYLGREKEAVGIISDWILAPKPHADGSSSKPQP